MLKFISILACKIINKLSKLTGHEGSVIGGYWATKIDKKILKKIRLPKYVIGITGSSGKSSSTELTYNILTKNGMKVVYNKEGSNTINGITALVLNNSSLTGKLKADVLLMELDEQFMKKVFEYITPTHLMITNITRDQPPRNSHPEKIYNAIKNAIPDGTHIILNVDDPIVNRIRINHKGEVTTYGVVENDYSFKTSIHNVDAAYCPICNSKLEYEYYHYGHIGSYNCPKYDFKRGKVDYEAKDIDVDNQKIKIKDNIVHLPSPFLYTVYFTTGCYSLCKALNLKDEDILKVLNDESIKTKRLTIYDFNNRKWQMLVSKNENNLSYKQSLDYIKHQKEDKTIILGFDSSSRRYKENDISWIWDIDFESLNDESIKNIILIGKFCYDMQLRMEYANIDKDKLIIVEDINNLSEILKNKTEGKIYSMVCFDKEIELKKIIKEDNNND